MFIMNDGKKTTVAGNGELFDNFVTTKQLSGYGADGAQFATVDDPNYKSARVRIMRFDQAFQYLPYDVRVRKLHFIFTYLQKNFGARVIFYHWI